MIIAQGARHERIMLPATAKITCRERKKVRMRYGMKQMAETRRSLGSGIDGVWGNRGRSD
jgi:hypothetical protein